MKSRMILALLLAVSGHASAKLTEPGKPNRFEALYLAYSAFKEGGTTPKVALSQFRKSLQESGIDTRSMNDEDVAKIRVASDCPSRIDAVRDPVLYRVVDQQGRTITSGFGSLQMAMTIATCTPPGGSITIENPSRPAK